MPGTEDASSAYPTTECMAPGEAIAGGREGSAGPCLDGPRLASAEEDPLAEEGPEGLSDALKDTLEDAVEDPVEEVASPEELGEAEMEEPGPAGAAREPQAGEGRFLDGLRAERAAAGEEVFLAEEKVIQVDYSWIDAGDKSEQSTGGDTSAAGICSRADDDDGGEAEASGGSGCLASEESPSGPAPPELLGDAGSEASAEPVGWNGEEEERQAVPEGAEAPSREEGEEAARATPGGEAAQQAGPEARDAAFAAAALLLAGEEPSRAGRAEEASAGVETPPVAGEEGVIGPPMVGEGRTVCSKAKDNGAGRTHEQGMEEEDVDEHLDNRLEDELGEMAEMGDDMEGLEEEGGPVDGDLEEEESLLADLDDIEEEQDSWTGPEDGDEGDDEEEGEPTSGHGDDDDGQAEQGSSAGGKERPARHRHGHGSWAPCRSSNSLLAPDTFRVRQGELNVVIRRKNLSIRQLQDGLESEMREGILKRLSGIPTRADAHYINVDVSDNDLGPEGTAVLVAFLRRLHDTGPWPVCVRSLRMFRNRVGDEGARSVVELIHYQCRPMTELHMSHNGITAFGAAMIVLAFGSATMARYPFRLCNRPLQFGGCWLRLERNDVEAPETLLDALKSQGGARVVETTWQQRDWGPCRAPPWANIEEEAPQVVLHVFGIQARPPKGGGKGSSTWPSQRSKERERHAARDCVQDAAKEVHSVATTIAEDYGTTVQAILSGGDDIRKGRMKGWDQPLWQAKEPKDYGDEDMGDGRGHSRHDSRKAARLNGEHREKEHLQKVLHSIARCRHDHKLEANVREHINSSEDPEREASRVSWLISRLRFQGYLQDHGLLHGHLGPTMHGGYSRPRDSRSCPVSDGSVAGRQLLQSLKAGGQDSRASRHSPRVIYAEELEASLGANAWEQEATSAVSSSNYGHHSHSPTNGHRSRAATDPYPGHNCNGFHHNDGNNHAYLGQVLNADYDSKDKKKGKNKIGAWQAAQAALHADPVLQDRYDPGAGVRPGRQMIQAESPPAVIFQ